MLLVYLYSIANYSCTYRVQRIRYSLTQKLCYFVYAYLSVSTHMEAHAEWAATGPRSSYGGH